MTLSALFTRLAAVVLLCALGACDSPRKQIVGKWKSESGGNGVEWEFLANGTLTTDGTPGRYSFGDNQRIKVQTRSATFVHQMELKGDHMTWTDPSGSKLEFSRLK